MNTPHLRKLLARLEQGQPVSDLLRTAAAAELPAIAATGPQPKGPRAYTPANRARVAVESFRSAAHAIGPITRGMQVPIVTRGQFSMIDAILHVLAEVGPSRISVWTWTIAEYEIARFRELMLTGDVTEATLVIDHGARNKNEHLIREWQQVYGERSVRYVLNHAKIATIESEDGHKVYLRGSMNLNCNPRFEQADVSEGCPGFDLVRRIELELPNLADDASGAEVYKATKVGDAFNLDQLAMFQGLSSWVPK